MEYGCWRKGLLGGVSYVGSPETQQPSERQRGTDLIQVPTSISGHPQFPANVHSFELLARE